MTYFYKEHSIHRHDELHLLFETQWEVKMKKLILLMVVLNVISNVKADEIFNYKPFYGLSTVSILVENVNILSKEDIEQYFYVSLRNKMPSLTINQKKPTLPDYVYLNITIMKSNPNNDNYFTYNVELSLEREVRLWSYTDNKVFGYPIWGASVWRLGRIEQFGTVANVKESISELIDHFAYDYLKAKDYFDEEQRKSIEKSQKENKDLLNKLNDNNLQYDNKNINKQ